ncbi:glycosyltransferase family 4 protein [Exiguobacterium qingdaonense]|uniref:glycosyltransferase family 4 protein n=1 Tax=Exiguobacterium qingdaonense TaxID=2751251 RepID=UPI001BE83DC6|nr:glycosyltransferase family 4 protein [Exiguobacterium qingdaonense]
MTKQRLVFLSNIAAPYQVKFCESLQTHFDAEFWFYERLTDRRPAWWKVPLGSRCRVMRHTIYSRRTNYFSFDVLTQLIRFRPDVLLLAGFTPFHAIILHIAKWFGIRVVVMSEPIRNVTSEDCGESVLLSKADAPRKTNGIYRLFKRADLLFGMGNVARKQFIEEFGFLERQVVSVPYPIDIEAHMQHPLRQKRRGDPIRLLFANRLIERYQPLVALEAYSRLKEEYPHLSLSMNQEGHLAEACRRYIEDHDVQDVTFLDDIQSWEDLHRVYHTSDILVLPATYSNGNLTIIEACASGMGIVVSHEVDNVDRHLHEGINCYKCEPTASALAAQVRRYVDDPERLTDHGRLSKQYVSHRLNENTAKVYADLVQPLTRKGDAHHAEAHVARRGDASNPRHPKSKRTGDFHNPL